MGKHLEVESVSCLWFVDVEVYFICGHGKRKK